MRIIGNKELEKIVNDGNGCFHCNVGRQIYNVEEQYRICNLEHKDVVNVELKKLYKNYILHNPKPENSCRQRNLVNKDYCKGYLKELKEFVEWDKK